MQKGQYILHAHGGELTEVPANKSLLPHDPEGHPQAVMVARAPDGSVYVGQRTLMGKSTDGGQTWTSYPYGCGPAGQTINGVFQILSDGTFISVTGGGAASEPVIVWASSDEGQTYEQISQIEVPAQYPVRYIMALCRLPADRLLCRIQISNADVDENYRKLISGTTMLVAYRSPDGGNNWESPNFRPERDLWDQTMCEWGSEGGTVQVPSGRLLAVIRHQRPLLPTDPPDVLVKTGASAHRHKFAYFGL